MRTVFLLVMLICLGCQNPEYSYDSQAARAEQAQSLVGHDNTVAGQSLTEFLGPRTGWILPADSSLVTGDVAAQLVDFGGRAAAMSADGYYLTAFHVVDGIQPVMVLPPNTPCENAQHSELAGADCVLSPGRIVKHFEPHDLALVKFGHRPQAYFEAVCSGVEEEVAVFVGATDGYVFGVERIGNGPYQARGRVVSISQESGRMLVTTSIPVRGGMSGTPCCDSRGRLVGVLTGGRTSHVRHRTLTSEFVTVSLDDVRAVMEADRRGN